MLFNTHSGGNFRASLRLQHLVKNRHRLCHFLGPVVTTVILITVYSVTHTHTLTHTHTYTRTHKLNKHETQITVLISGLNYKESAMFKKKTKQNQLET